MRRSKGLPGAAAFALCVAAAGGAAAKDPPLLSLTAEHFRDTAAIKDEPSGGGVSISTHNGFVEHSGPLHMVWHDEYLTALIDKKTGDKSFQVHEEVTYNGNWRYYQSAGYQASDGPRSVPAVQISKEVANCAVGDCIYTEHIAFPVDEEVLRQLAAVHAAGKPVMWPFKAIAKSGPAYAGGLSTAEITGLLLKVDEYTHTPTVVGAGAAAAPIRLDFGIGGMAVAATPEQPNRAGILIMAVTPGSVAHRSGLIVGDILYDIDGHATKQLADLQAAIAACKANTAVSLKLFRGTEPLALTARF